MLEDNGERHGTMSSRNVNGECGVRDLLSNDIPIDNGT